MSLEYLGRLVLKGKVGSSRSRGREKNSHAFKIAIPSFWDLPPGQLSFFPSKTDYLNFWLKYFLHFHAVFRKFWSNNKLGLAPRGNPGSANGVGICKSPYIKVVKLKNTFQFL